MARQPNALKDRIDAIRAEDPGMAKITRLDENAAAFALTVREILREVRKSQGLTLTDMADRLNVTQPTVSAIERGEGDIGVKTLARYLGALDVDLMHVLTDIRHSVRDNSTVTPSPRDDGAGAQAAAPPRSGS